MHTTPLISCFALPSSEYHRRVDLAEDKADALCVKHERPDGRYGREILWHPLFPAEFVASLSQQPLHEITVCLAYLDNDYNDSQPLDLHDLGYLADVLREALAGTPTPQASARLSRALAWVEQQGEALLVAPSLPTSALASPRLAVAA